MNLYLFILFFLGFSSIFSIDLATYSYQTNGAEWTGLCSSGMEQSPIEIDSESVSKCDADMILDINWMDLAISSETQDNGATLKNYGNFSTLYASDIDGNVYGYDASEFQFHSPSEHVVDSKHFDIELQIIHKARPEFGLGNGRPNAIISILFEIDDSNIGSSFLAQYQATAASKFSYNLKTLLGDYIEKPIRYFAYKGSMNVPPCEESVNWYVLEKTIKMTTAQYKKFSDKWAMNLNFAQGKGNNRKTMGINGREVKMGGIKSEECKEDFVSFFGFFVLFIFWIYFTFKVFP